MPEEYSQRQIRMAFCKTMFFIQGFDGIISRLILCFVYFDKITYHLLILRSQRLRIYIEIYSAGIKQ